MAIHLLTTVLGTIFLVSAVAKLLVAGPTIAWVRGLGVPRPSEATGAAIVWELAATAGLLNHPSAGAIAALTFTLAMTPVLVLAGRSGVGCRCFGRLEPDINQAAIRNLALAAGSIIVIITRPKAPPDLLLVGALCSGLAISVALARRA